MFDNPSIARQVAEYVRKIADHTDKINESAVRTNLIFERMVGHTSDTATNLAAIVDSLRQSVSPANALSTATRQIANNTSRAARHAATLAGSTTAASTAANTLTTSATAAAVAAQRINTAVIPIPVNINRAVAGTRQFTSAQRSLFAITLAVGGTVATLYGKLQREGVALGQSHRIITNNFKNWGDLLETGVIASLNDMNMASVNVGRNIGNIEKISKELVASTVELSTLYNVSEISAAKLNAQLFRWNGQQGAAIRSAQHWVSALAQANGVIPGDLFEEMAEHTDDLARAASAGARGFAHQLIGLRKMGVEMRSISSMGDRLVGDFEGTLEAAARLQTFMPGFDMSGIQFAAQFGNNEQLALEVRTALQRSGVQSLSNLPRSLQNSLAGSLGLTLTEIENLLKSSNDSIKINTSSEDIAAHQETVMKNLAQTALNKGDDILKAITGGFNGVLAYLFGRDVARGIFRAMGRGISTAARFGGVNSARFARIQQIAASGGPGAARARQIVNAVGVSRGSSLAGILGSINARLAPFSRILGPLGVAAVAGSSYMRGNGIGGAIGAGAGLWGGAAAGAAGGAALGSIVPGPGNIVGGIIGGFVGGLLGSKLGESIGKTITNLFSPTDKVIKSQEALTKANKEAAKVVEDSINITRKINDSTTTGSTSLWSKLFSSPLDIRPEMHHTGGIVGKDSIGSGNLKDMKSNEVLAILQRGEIVLTAKQMISMGKALAGSFMGNVNTITSGFLSTFVSGSNNIVKKIESTLSDKNGVLEKISNLFGNGNISKTIDAKLSGVISSIQKVTGDSNILSIASNVLTSSSKAGGLLSGVKKFVGSKIASVANKIPLVGGLISGIAGGGNIKSMATSALKSGAGKAIGATIGSVIPGAGTVVGALAGMGIDKLMNSKVGKAVTGIGKKLFGGLFGKKKKSPTVSPQNLSVQPGPSTNYGISSTDSSGLLIPSSIDGGLGTSIGTTAVTSTSTAPVVHQSVVGMDDMIKKFDELITLMRNGGIAVNLDGRKVSAGILDANRYG